jgi:Ca2+-transporting ATPase
MNPPTATAEDPKSRAWHRRSAEDALAQLGSAAAGLAAQEAAKRLAADGPNELQEGPRISPLRMFLSQFKSLII